MNNISDITTITGKVPGKTVTIMAGIHGNETCGIEAFKEEVSNISIQSGTVHFIIGNPEAVNKKIRSVEMDLNRAFRPKEDLSPTEKQSYERKRAEELMPLLNASDALLDIHSMASTETTPFIICAPHSFSISSKLPFSIVSYGWDTIEPGGTDYYMNRIGKHGICVECGNHNDPKAIEKARSSIDKFLSIFGSKTGKKDILSQELDQEIVKVTSIYHSKINFEAARTFDDFEEVTKGELLGQDGEREVFAEKNGVILFVRNRKEPGQEAFILGHKTNASE